MAAARKPYGKNYDVDPQGLAVDPSSWGFTSTVDGSGNVLTMTTTDNVDTWVKTFTYTTGVTSGSAWVRS